MIFSLCKKCQMGHGRPASLARSKCVNMPKKDKQFIKDRTRKVGNVEKRSKCTIMMTANGCIKQARTDEPKSRRYDDMKGGNVRRFQVTNPPALNATIIAAQNG
jgi:hypothetical protein